MSFLADNKKKDDLIMISWFKKQRDQDLPSLAIVFESGIIQLMKNENDNGEDQISCTVLLNFCFLIKISLKA